MPTPSSQSPEPDSPFTFPASHPPANSFPVSPRTARAAWIAACILCATAAFFIGRASAPRAPAATKGQRSTLADLGARSRTTGSSARRQAPALPAGLAAGDATDPADPIAKKQAEIVALLAPFKDGDQNELGPELLGLITWANTADEEGLLLLFGTAKAMMPESPTYRNLILPVGYTHWAQLDPQAAFDALLALDDDDRSEEVAKAVLNGWILQGPARDALDHGLALLKADPSLNSRGDNLVGNMLVKLYQTDPAQADEIALALARSADPLEKEVANSAAASQVGNLCDKEGPKAALEWIAHWPDAETRTTLNEQLIYRLMNGDDTAQKTAVELFQQFATPDASLFGSVAAKRARLDLTEAQAWALNLPSGDNREAAVRGIVNTMDDDGKIEGAIRWLSTVPPDEDLDGAFGKIALSTLDKNENFSESFEFSKRIVNPSTATEVQSELIQRWLSMDRDAAVRVLGPAMEQAVRIQPDAPAPQ